MGTRWKYQAAAADWYQALPADPMTQRALDSLGAYDFSNPTGATIGKVWKRNIDWHIKGAPPRWLICEYVACPTPEHPDCLRAGPHVHTDHRRPEIVS